MKIGDGSITYKNCVRQNSIYQYIEPQGVTVVNFNISSLYEGSANGSYHFKISLVLNYNVFGEAEGTIGMTGDGRLLVNYKSNLINDITINNNTKNIVVQVNDNIWSSWR